MYLEDRGPLVASLCELAGAGGLVSIVAKKAEVMAMRHAHEGDWAATIAASDSDRQVNGLGVDTRGDRIEDLTTKPASAGVEPIGWYGVRLLTYRSDDRQVGKEGVRSGRTRGAPTH